MNDPESPSGRAEADPSDPVLAEWVEELNRKLQAGEPVDIEAYAREHPERAEELRRLLPAIAMMADLGRSLAPDSGAAAPAGPDPVAGMGVLGDYRIVREIGRGGMGVVYEARQVSLGRRVALKVLPFASAMDPRHLQRFQIEAQAAACLHHTNIVPVHAVGSERGVSYYAMQFIEGRNLAEVIGELRQLDGLDPAVPEAPAIEPGGVSFDLASGLFDPKPPGTGGDASTVAHSTRTPDAEGDPVTTVPARVPSDAETVTPGEARPPSAPPPPQPTPPSATGRSSRTRAFFRTAAHLGLQAAEALDYAHEKGVLHRDIKPANLLIDGRGKLWVTDFGLARMQNDAGLTMTGDLLGTLRYMSPEQALARRVVIDGRTDVYSLGVTLYELLTLHPVLDGRDRADLLRRIAQEEPRPLRRLNPAVPADLETIVLKAMAKEMSGRYATARALADDLQRFLDGQSIQARRPSVLDRAAKWSRRHKPVVASAAVLLVVAVVGLAASTVLVGREQARTLAAYRAESEQRAEAESQRRRAESNFRRARDAVDQMLTEVAEKDLALVPQMEPVRRVLLERALAFYQEFAREQSSDPAVRAEMARAYERVGRIQLLLGHHQESEAAYRRALGIYERLTVEFPSRHEYRFWMSGMYMAIGNSLLSAGRHQDAEGAYRRSLDLWTSLADEPSMRSRALREKMRPYINLGLLLTDAGRLDEAEQAYRGALAVREQLAAEFPDVQEGRDPPGDVLDLLGGLQVRAGRVRDAEQTFRQALALYEKLAAEMPESRYVRFALVHIHQNLGGLLQKTDRLAEAERAHRKALDLAEVLVADPLADPRDRQGLVDAYLDWGSLLRETGRPREAEAAYRRSLTVSEKLAADFPARPDYQAALADVHHLLGQLFETTDRSRDAEAAYRRALAIQESVAARSTARPEDRRLLANILTALGSLLDTTGQTEGAGQCYRRALDLAETLAAEFPRDGKARLQMAKTSMTFGNMLGSAGQFSEAEKARRRAVEILEGLTAQSPANREYRSTLAFGLFNFGGDLKDKDPRGAERVYRRAAALLEELAADRLGDLQERRCLILSLDWWSRMLEDLGEHAEAVATCRRFGAVAEALVTEHSDQPNYHGYVAIACEHLAWLLAQAPDPRLRDPAGAARSAKLALDACGRAVVRAEAQVADAPDGPDQRKRLAQWRAALASMLTHGPDPQLNDPAGAVELARSAVELAPQDEDYVRTLGSAQYRAGDPKTAIATLEPVKPPGPGGDGEPLFILAMAHWQLGARDRARTGYDTAVTWMDEHKPHNVSLRRIRAEAASLMGLKDGPTPAEAGGPPRKVEESKKTP